MARPTKRQQKNKNIGLGVSKLTSDNILKLEQVYSLDASIAEVACYLDVSIQTIYNWEKKNPKLFEKLHRLAEKPVLKARQTITKGLDDANNAKWYLERKRKKEFAERKELSGEDGEPIKLDVSITDAIKKAYKKRGT